MQPDNLDEVLRLRRRLGELATENVGLRLAAAGANALALAALDRADRIARETAVEYERLRERVFMLRPERSFYDGQKEIGFSLRLDARALREFKGGDPFRFAVEFVTHELRRGLESFREKNPDLWRW